MSYNTRGAAAPAAFGGHHHLSLLERALLFVPPWVAAAALWPLGALLHWLWDSPGALAWAGVALTMGSFALVAVTHKITANRPSMRLLALSTVAGACAWMIAAVIVGPAEHPVVDIWLVGGLVLAISWNVRRVFGGKENAGESSAESKFFEAVKLRKSRFAGEIEAGEAKVKADVQVPAGEMTSDDVVKARGNMASALGVPPSGVTVSPDPDRADRASVTVVPRDMLREPIPWPGASRPGGSIIEPVRIGIYQDSEPLEFAQPGDKSRARPAGHVLTMGMTGSGKTQGAKCVWCELSTRTDVVLWAAAGSKGMQTMGILKGTADWLALTPEEGRAMVKALPSIIQQRSDYLGTRGLDEWTPDCGLPYLVVWLEEASEMVADNDTFTEATRSARSVGVGLVSSLQRAVYDAMPVSARNQHTIRWAYGLQEPGDTRMVLSEQAMERGAAPDAWGAKKPGYCYIEAPGLEDDRVAMPARTYLITDDEFLATTEEWAPYRAELDSLTAKAAGKAYAQRARYTVDDARPTGVIEGEVASGQAPPETDAERTGEIDPVTSDDDGPGPAGDPFSGSITAAEEQDEIEVGGDDGADDDLGEIDSDTEIPADDSGVVIDWPDRRPSHEEVVELLHQVLEQLRSNGTTVIGPKDIPDEFPRSRSWVSEKLKGLAAEGELIETEAPGRYRFPPEGGTPAHIGNAA